MIFSIGFPPKPAFRARQGSMHDGQAKRAPPNRSRARAKHPLTARKTRNLTVQQAEKQGMRPGCHMRPSPYQTHHQHHANGTPPRFYYPAIQCCLPFPLVMKTRNPSLLLYRDDGTDMRPKKRLPSTKLKPLALSTLSTLVWSFECPAITRCRPKQS